jgi:2-polyprenyl-3-methyl-5-hydroxy-6-metoxy-1,4-benzoquinol methylase
MKRKTNNTTRSQHEIEHGELLSTGDTETIWGWGTPAGRWRARQRAALIASGGQLAPGKRVLEIGCGTGLFTEMFAINGAHITAVDISADLLARARERQLPDERVRFIEKRFEDCDLEGPFDAVIGSSVLHHLELEAALTKIHSLLKPGGIMSFAEPNLLNPRAFMMFNFRQWFPYISPGEHVFTRWYIQRLLQQVGFAGIRIKPFDWLHPATPPALIDPVQALGWALEQAKPVREFAGSLHIIAQKPA